MIEKLISKKTFDTELEEFNKLIKNNPSFAEFVELAEQDILKNPKSTVDMHEGLLLGVLILISTIIKTGGDLATAVEMILGPQIHLMVRLGFKYDETQELAVFKSDSTPQPVIIPESTSQKDLNDMIDVILRKSGFGK